MEQESKEKRQCRQFFHRWWENKTTKERRFFATLFFLIRMTVVSWILSISAGEINLLKKQKWLIQQNPAEAVKTENLIYNRKI